MTLKYLINEYKLLLKEIKSLDFKITYIFISVSLIVFVSMVFASPTFYYEHIGKDKLMSRVYWFLSDGLIMFLIPVLSIKFVFKQKLSDFGFRFGDFKFGLFTSLLFLGFMLPVVWIASASQTFAETYPQGGSVLRENIGLLALYEICILIYMLGWEFIWRGYMLFGLKEKFGYFAIFIQMLPFYILHRGKPDIELFASILAGLILGIQAWRSRSFIYCWLLHWFVMVSIDFISVFRYTYKFYKLF